MQEPNLGEWQKPTGLILAVTTLDDRNHGTDLYLTCRRCISKKGISKFYLLMKESADLYIHTNATHAYLKHNKYGSFMYHKYGLLFIICHNMAVKMINMRY